MTKERFKEIKDRVEAASQSKSCVDCRGSGGFGDNPCMTCRGVGCSHPQEMHHFHIWSLIDSIDMVKEIERLREIEAMYEGLCK